MKTQYEEISRQLERIDFEALWPGFHPYPFALYDGAHAILDGQFMDCPVSLDREAPASWACVLSERTTRRETLIRAFLEKSHTTVKGSFRICGYDPMHLWREGDTLYSTSFLALADEAGNTVTLTGRALLQMLPGSPDTALAYSTAIPGT